MRRFIDFVDWEPRSNDIFAYKYPQDNLSTGTQLIVRESQEAVFFGKGRLLQKFGPGKYTLSTENIPLLRNLYGIPFEGKNPFAAEVWFVNKTAPLNINWRTDVMRIADPIYGPLPLYAAGRYGLKVMDAERFLIQLVGTLQQFTARELTDHFYGDCVTKTKSTISAYMTYNNLGLNYVSGHMDEMSANLTQQLSEFWEKYGFNLESFNITTIDFDTSSPQNQKLYESYTRRLTRDMEGYTVQQEKMLDAMGNGRGAGGGIMMAAMLMGSMNGGNSAMGNAVGNVMQNMVQPTNVQNALNQQAYGMNQGYGMNQPNQGYGMNQANQGYSMNQANQGYGMNQANQGYGTNQMNSGYGMNQQAGGMRRQTIICARCGTKRPTDQLFCPSCGKKYRPCQTCGRDAGEKETRCVKCGSMLQMDVPMDENYCSFCGSPVKATDKCCPYCGKMIKR